jgi:CheY-like chemotaxis protein
LQPFVARDYVVDMVQGDVAGKDSPRAQPLVLIVEDDQSTRMLYKEYLTESGFRTVEAHNGFQAFEKAQEHRPDAVVTDLAVPGMDGFEFCRALRASASTKNVPIVAITGYPDYLANPERIRQAGITRVMTKPCNLENIVQELRRLLNGQGTI